MKNLAPYNKNCFQFHKTVVKSKRDTELKTRISELDSIIQDKYDIYSYNVENDTLHSITKHIYQGSQKEDLLKLYSFKNSNIQKLLILLTTLEGRKFNTCQMCSIEPVGSFDHIVPKEEFLEYVVNPINLLPCCSTCNSKKGKRWLENNKRIFLNLYYDKLPNERYLKIDFNTFPIPVFSIDKTKLNHNIYDQIQSHYEKLDLFKRFKDNSNKVITSLLVNAKNYVQEMGIIKYRKVVEKSTNEMLVIYGENHWESLLEMEIVNHADFETLL